MPTSRAHRLALRDTVPSTPIRTSSRAGVPNTPERVATMREGARQILSLIASTAMSRSSDCVKMTGNFSSTKHYDHEHSTASRY
jgi:hypothetical protein